MCVDNSNEHELEEEPIPHVLTADGHILTVIHHIDETVLDYLM